ncbi:MAG: hypothetical protein ABIV48_01060, partial [Pyrinomonadaceae bacterium]
ANRSSVVFYTVDARGLVYTGFTAADSPSISNPQSLTDALSKRGAQLTDTQDGLRYLAEETGGFLVKNNNDLAGGVRRVLEDQSYYLVAYEPDSDTFDAEKRKFNQISIKVTRTGAKARYRSGFFNVADKIVPNAPTVSTPRGQLESALVSPFAISGINLRLNALFGSDPQTGSYVRSLLHVNAADLKFTDEKDGIKKAMFDVIAMSFGDNGQPVDQLAKTYTLNIPPAAYKKIAANGFVYHFVFPVKKPGAYQYRVAIRDAIGGKVGSASQFIEVPNLKKNRLTTSSMIIENVSPKDWAASFESPTKPPPTDPMSDTALRRIKIGSYLRYGFEIYNAKLNPAKLPQLQTRIRVFRDGQLVLDGKPQPFELRGQTDMRHLKTVGAISIGDKMLAGDYILQVIVTDALAKTKQQIATQFVQFEIVE